MLNNIRIMCISQHFHDVLIQRIFQNDILQSKKTEIFTVQ